MSIISDALKKAQEEKRLSTKSKVDPSSMLPLQGVTKTAKKSKKGQKVIFSLMLILAVSGIVFFIITKKLSFPPDDLFAKLRGSVHDKEELIPTSSRPATATLAEVPGHKQEGQEFLLSGILFDSTKPLAIINGKMVGLGSQIGEARILDIQPYSVKLSYKGEELVLHLQ